MPRRKGRAKGAAPKVMPARRPGRPRADDISAVVRSLQGYHAQLLDRRAQLEEQISAVESALRAVGAAAGGRPTARVGRGPGRPPGGAPRPGSLKDYILRVLSSGGVMAVKDIAAAVVKAGYQSKNKTLAKSVGIALRQLKEVRKVGRGRFRLK